MLKHCTNDVQDKTTGNLFCSNPNVYRNSSLSTVAGLRAENPSNRGSIPGKCNMFDTTSKLPDPPPPLGPTHSPSQWAPGILSAWVKLLRCQADPPNTEVKKKWSYSSTHPSAFHVVRSKEVPVFTTGQYFCDLGRQGRQWS
jgi:hypothetical protein